MNNYFTIILKKFIFLLYKNNLNPNKIEFEKKKKGLLL